MPSLSRDGLSGLLAEYIIRWSFFVGIFNQQPMGFYSLETLKEDARRHGIPVLNPDVNKSQAVCVIENNAIRLGFLNVIGLGSAAVKEIKSGRAKQGTFNSIAQFLESTGVLKKSPIIWSTPVPSTALNRTAAM